MAASGAPGNTVNAARMDMQQWQNFPFYMRQAQWDILRSEERQLNKVKMLGGMLVSMPAGSEALVTKAPKVFRADPLKTFGTLKTCFGRLRNLSM